MHGVVHDSGVHEMIEGPAREAVEGREEVFEGVGADEEGAAVVAEEVVGQGNGFGYCGCGGGASEGGSVEVEPGVVGAGEALGSEGTGGGGVGEVAGHDGAAGEREEDSVEVVHVRVGHQVLDFLDGGGDAADGVVG